MDSFLRCVLPEPGTLFTSHNTQGGFSVCVCVCVCVCVLVSRVQLFATPWAVAQQAPLSVGFPRQEY